MHETNIINVVLFYHYPFRAQPKSRTSAFTAEFEQPVSGYGENRQEPIIIKMVAVYSKRKTKEK